MKLLAVDSNSVLNRAFYGVKLLSAKDGTFTNGIFGYLNILMRVVDEVQPDAIACAFDLPAPTFRHQMYDGYKAQRKGMPAELAMQLPILRELLAALGFTVVDCEGYEADDILGTLAKASCAQGQQCVIATGDRDTLQLIDPCIQVRLTTTKMGRPESVIYDEAAIMEKYGVTPKQLIDVKALMGDASDNIPGVAGIGEKTALDLIARFESVDNIYENIETIDIKAGVRQKLIDGKEQCYMSRELAEINCEAPVSTVLADYVRTEGDPAKAYEILRRLEMYKMIEKFGLTPGTSANGEEEPVAGEAVQATPEKVTARVATAQALEKALDNSKVDVLFEMKEDEVSAFVVKNGDELLFATAGQEGFGALVDKLLDTSAKLRTNQSKLLYRCGYKLGRELEPVAFDAELAGYLLNPTASEYSLDRLCAEYNLVPSTIEGEDVPAVAGHAAMLTRLCDRLAAEIVSNGMEELLYKVEIPLAQVLASMEWLGFELDAEGLRAFGRELETELAAIEGRIYEYAGEKFNINSPKQLGEVLFGKLGLPSRKKTKTGYSTNAEVLESLKGMHPIIDDILEYRKLTKLVSTYVEGLLKVIGEDGRVHTSFQQTETRTGRISSIEPNMQNIPVRTEIGSNLRKFFHARDGWELVDADYSQIELRVLAHIANDANMISAFASGEDIHTQTASQVFNMPPLYVTPIMRSRAKAVNFGIVYGIGAFSLSQDIGVSVSEADSYIKDYLKTFGGVSKYMDETKKFAEEQGYVSTLLGRRRYLPELASSNKITKAFGQRVAMNMPIQGTAADIIKIAMIRVFRRLRSEGLEARLVLQVHDELIVECPEGEVEQVSKLLKEEMEGAMKLKVPLDVDVGTGHTWYESK